MAKLTRLGDRLQPLRSQLGSLPRPERSAEAERAAYAPWRAWYGTAAWKALRLRIFTRDLFT